MSKYNEQAYSERSEQSLRHVGDDDPDEEDDRVDPVVLEDHRQEEEADAEEDGDGGDDVDEVLDLARDRRLTRLDRRRQIRYAAHHRVVARADNDPARRSLQPVGKDQTSLSKSQKFDNLKITEGN